MLPSLAPAQHVPTLGRDLYFRFDKAVNKPTTNFHSNVKPYIWSELDAYVDRDSLNKVGLFKNGRKLAFGKDTTGKSIDIRAWPVALFQPGYESSYAQSDLLFRGGLGAGLSIAVGERFDFRVSHLNANGSYPQFITDFADTRGVIPGQGIANGTSIGKHNQITTGYVNYTASKNFNFQLGHGKNFWGDGYRSLLLSDVANNYTYLKGTGTIWKIKYVVLYTHLKDINVPNANSWGQFDNKYTTAHYLSYNVTDWLNISLFESIVWQAKDTVNDRGYDVAYLNPIIFLRPVEFSRGSPDNALIGSSVRISPHKKLQFYGQVVLDEFLLAEVRAGNGWWANKQGIQLGAKYFDAFGVEGLHLQGEANRVRPFTYSHAPSTQNWAHYNQPLAHPIGANFTEMLGFIRYEKPSWSVEARLSLASYGIDSVGSAASVGQDVYRDYLSFQNAYGHTTGQGIPVDLNIMQLKGTYRLFPEIDMVAEAGVMIRSHTVGGTQQNTNMVFFGIRTALNEFYNDF